VVVDSSGAPFLIGQRVLVKFVRGQQQAQAAATPAS
jgi:HlyD family secretion protein